MQKDAAGSGRRVSVSDPGNGSHAGSYPHACVIRCVAFIVSFAENHPFAALIYVPHMRQLNVRN